MLDTSASGHTTSGQLQVNLHYQHMIQPNYLVVLGMLIIVAKETTS